MIIAALVALSAQTAGWDRPAAAAALSGAEVRAVEVTADGSVWLAVRDRGLARVSAGETVWFTVDDGLVSNGIADLHEDSRGRLWAVGAGGYSRREDERWTGHATIGGLRPPVVFGVSEAPSGAIWLAANGGAGREGREGWQTLTPSDGLPHQVVHDVVVGREGDVWLACRQGLARVRRGALDVFHPAVNFRSAALGPDGTLWFGTPSGLYSFDGDSWGIHFEGEPVFPLLVAADGTLWAGSSGTGLRKWGADGWESVALPDDLDSAEVHGLAETPDGSIWVATSRGPARYVGG